MSNHEQTTSFLQVCALMCSVRDIWTEMQTKNELQSGTNDPRVLCLRIWRSQSQKEQVGYYDSSLVLIYLLSRHDTWQEQSKHRYPGTGWHHKRTRQNKTHREQHLCSRMLQDASGCFKNLRHVWDIWDQYANRRCKQEQVTQNCYVRNLEVQIARTATGLLWSSS